ncbi:exported protein of unknown function [Hyphomicrobium sp. 1Nfss2.1]|uniref:hypothetical protein n=1 Tax=Hyphomicrobium sp. 1Nfss2.1 TaxID=3413936 RepID=UPI003C7D772F
MKMCHPATPILAFLCGLVVSLLPSPAGAACGITSVTLASFISETTPPMRHGGTASAYTRLTATFSGPGDNSDADCRIAIRSSTGRVTLFSDPTKSINYSIATLRTGGSVVSYTMSPSSFIPVTRGARQFDLYVVIPDGNHTLGTYFDMSAYLEVYDGAVLVVSTGFQSAPPQIHYNSPIEDSCTIGSTFDGGTRVLDFSNGSTISLVQQFATFGDVTCSGAADVTLSSANGAVTNASSVSIGSFQRYFDYVATTTINGVAVTLDTSQLAATGNAESVTVIVPSGIANAPLSVGVTPKQPAKRLPAGAYADVLTISVIAR